LSSSGGFGRNGSPVASSIYSAIKIASGSS
jgi:hypothetical protein